MARPFVFVLHHHQPPGNLPSVMAAAHERCYRPLLAALEAHPSIRSVLHFSGSLLEWMVREDPAYVERIRALVEDRRAEILGGGFYDPILHVLPDHDATGQVEMMSMFLERYVGTRPTGVWLAEREWDADLPRLLAPAGMTHTFIDDHHFFRAGLDPEAIGGAPITEKAGHALRVLPIARHLRYAIPFNGPSDVIRAIVESPGDQAVVYADDAEKLGLWPDTHRWVFEERWLERFLRALEEAQDEGRIETVFSSALVKAPPKRRVYFAGGGYDALGAWAMSAKAQRDRQRTQERLLAAGLGELAIPREVGAPWSSFLAKYPEADRLHKKMLRVSERLQNEMEIAIDESEHGRLEGDVGDLLGTAQRDLYRGQSACVYWHGLFGGIYLSFLRRAAFGALIHADRILDRLQQGADDFVAYEERDVDLDGHDEIIIANRALEVVVQPSRGGVITQLDHKPSCVDVADVMTVHEEPYREDRDDHPRVMLVDRLLLADDANDVSDLSTRRYEVVSLDVRREGVAAVELSMRSKPAADGLGLAVEKRFVVPMEGGTIHVDYVVQNVSDHVIEGTWTVEIPTTFSGDPEEAPNDRVVDAAAGVDVTLTCDGAERSAYFLVADTQREDGTVPTLHGHVTTFGLPVSLAPRAEWRFAVRIALDVTNA